MTVPVEDACPKRMRFGPCGGTQPDGSCEVGPFPCPFVDRPLAATPTAEAATPPMFGAAEAPPVIVVDVRAPAPPTAPPPNLWHRTAEALEGCWALIGDHVDNPAWVGDTGYLAPEEAVAILAAGGVPTIATVTGRSASLDVAVERAEALRGAGATAVHCVTGDHPAGLGIDRAATFGTESIPMVAAVAALAPVTVAEAPASPGPRVERLAAKRRAGASAAILNHAGPLGRLVDFADRCTAAGADLPLVAPVPMVADVRRAAALAAFPGLQLPPGMLEAIATASDPAAEGLRWAADIAAELVASGRFAGLNLSGSAGGDDPLARLSATRTFIDGVSAAIHNAA